MHQIKTKSATRLHNEKGDGSVEHKVVKSNVNQNEDEHLEYEQSQFVAVEQHSSK